MVCAVVMEVYAWFVWSHKVGQTIIFHYSINPSLLYLAVLGVMAGEVGGLGPGLYGEGVRLVSLSPPLALILVGTWWGVVGPADNMSPSDSVRLNTTREGGINKKHE